MAPLALSPDGARIRGGYFSVTPTLICMLLNVEFQPGECFINKIRIRKSYYAV